jgi:hypothetical protein
MNKIITTQKKQYYSIEDPDKLIEYINDNISPNEKEKKKYGEVFTPIELVEEMLDKLPNEVWSNPHLRWLDPAVGIGNFPIIAYLKLMDGLKEWKPDDEERRKHILENMLYMVEINNKNIIILNKLLCGHKYKLNIFEGSFIDGNYYTSLNYSIYNTDLKFDIIMGNPPFNNGKSKNNPIYHHFCLKSIKYLNTNGYLLFIHPPAWKRVYTEDNKSLTGVIYYKYKNLYLIYIKLNLNISNFPSVDYYLLQNIRYNGKYTEVENYFNNKEYRSNVVLSNTYNFLPNLITKESISILNKLLNKEGVKFSIQNPRNVVINNKTREYISDKKTETHIYPHYHYHKKGKAVFMYVVKEFKIEDYDKPKIIMSFNYSPYILHAWYDENGEYGLTDFGMYQLIDTSLSNSNIIAIVDFLNSKLIQFILKITQYSSPPYTKNEFKILNEITIPILENKPTDQDIYNYYGITKQEQNLIEGITI